MAGSRSLGKSRRNLEEEEGDDVKSLARSRRKLEEEEGDDVAMD